MIANVVVVFPEPLSKFTIPTSLLCSVKTKFAASNYLVVLPKDFGFGEKKWIILDL